MSFFVVILSDREASFHIFIHAKNVFKKDRIANLYGETKEKPAKRLADKDRKRSVNYKYYTDRTWGEARNYHLCLDSSELGIEKVCCSHM